MLSGTQMVIELAEVDLMAFLQAQDDVRCSSHA